MLGLNILFLDDNPDRTKRFLEAHPYADTVETAEECIKALQDKPYDIVFLDHDLGGEQFVDSGREDTGMEVARWCCENYRVRTPVSLFVIHSCNHPAAHEMGLKLDNLQASVIVRSFHHLFSRYRGS